MATTILRSELSRLTSPIDHDRERSLLLWLLADVRTPAALATLGDVAIAGYFCSYNPHPDGIVAWNF
jgi:hypothetical protein